jgi:hypothetical protein
VKFIGGYVAGKCLVGKRAFIANWSNILRVIGKIILEWASKKVGSKLECEWN